jgi:hypothetical protein
MATQTSAQTSFDACRLFVKNHARPPQRFLASRLEKMTASARLRMCIRESHFVSAVREFSRAPHQDDLQPCNEYAGHVQIPR